MNVSLTPELEQFVDGKVESGLYNNASEVIREGLRALQARDAAIERWLREEVVPTALEMQAHPERGIPIDEVMKGIRALHAERIAKS